MHLNNGFDKMTYERSFQLLNSKFKELFFPTLLAAVAGNFAILADAFIVSALLGPMNLSVIQCISPLSQFVNVIYWLIGIGGTILATSAKANFNDKKADYIFTLSIISVTIISLLITMAGLLFPDYFMGLLCPSTQLRPLFYEYYIYYILAIPLLCYLVVLAYFAKTDDFVQLQFKAFLMVDLLNVIFDVVFIKYFNMGIAGASLALLIAHIIAVIYISSYFLKSKRTLRFIKIEIGKSMKCLIDICKTGFSSSSIALYQSLKLIIINSIILGVLRDAGLVAFNICCNTTILVCIFIFGTAQSILPIVSVYYQEKDFNGVDYVARRSLKIVIAFGIFFTLLFVAFPQTVLYLFSVRNLSDIPNAMNAVRIFSLCFLPYSINFLYIFYLQSIQNNKLANILTLLNGLIFPVVFVLIFSGIWNENGIWFAFVISEVVTLIVIYLYSKYLNKKTNGEYSGFFLKERDKTEKMMGYTIQANKRDASGLSREVKDFLGDNETSELVSLAIEELTDYILDMNDDLDWMDVIVRDNDESAIISMKYSGIGYNPKDSACLNSDNIASLLKISDDIDNSQILGLNNTVITFKKQ